MIFASAITKIRLTINKIIIESLKKKKKKINDREDMRKTLETWKRQGRVKEILLEAHKWKINGDIAHLKRQDNWKWDERNFRWMSQYAEYKKKNRLGIDYRYYL